MTADECKREIVQRLEQASGKPVIVQSDKSFSAHATIKIAGPDRPAHVLLYKPQFEAELPYLVFFPMCPGIAND